MPRSSRPPEERIDLANRITLRPAEAARVLGVSERTLRTMLPELPCIREGGAVLLPVDGLRRWAEERAEATGKRTDALAREVIDSLK